MAGSTTDKKPNAENIYLGMPDQAVTGAVLYAPEGTAMPEYPAATLNSAFSAVGYVDEDGVTIGGLKAAGDALRDWGGVKVRQLPGEADPMLSFGMLETSEESLALIVGKDNAESVTATTTHGNLTKAKFTDDMPEAHSMVIRLKDGERRAIVNIPRCQVSEIEDIELTRTGAIKWKPTFAILGDSTDGYIEVIFDDGKVVKANGN